MRLLGQAFGPERDEDVEQLAEEFRALATSNQERLSRYRQHREELERGRDPSLQRMVGDNFDYGQWRGSGSADPERHRLELPFGRAIVIKHTQKLGTRIPDVTVERRGENPQEVYRANAMERIVWGIWAASGGLGQMASAAWDGSELGSSVFQAHYDLKQRKPLVCAVDPATTLVVPGAYEPHRYERTFRFWDAPLYSVVAEYGKYPFRGRPVDVQRIEPNKESLSRTVTIVEAQTPETTIRFTLNGHLPLWEEEHRLGFCPTVVIPNIGPERLIWGFSDYEGIRTIAAYISRVFSREADIIRAVSNGAVQLTGSSRVDSKKVMEVLKKGGVAAVGKDGKVEPIQPPDTPDFQDSHFAMAVEFMKMLGFVPDASWGLGSAPSGSERGLQMMPQLELGALKQVNWSSGLSRLFGYCFRMIEQKQIGTAVYRGTQQQGATSKAFVLELQADLTDADASVFPQTPKELFDGDYACEFAWPRRVDLDDPAYVASELNKFAQGAQSLETTLERFGFKNAQDEINRIANEAEQYPWLRSGMIALIQAQLQGANQGETGGAPFDQAEAIGGASEMMGQPGGQALASDAMGGALEGGVGEPYGGA